MSEMKLCQSCAMPLIKEEEFGTNADESKNTDYCIYCFKEGAFLDDMSMDEMIEFCVPLVSKGNPYSDEQTARDAMKAYFPTLKRWK